MGDRGQRPPLPSHVHIQDIMNRPLLAQHLDPNIETGTEQHRPTQQNTRGGSQRAAHQAHRGHGLPHYVGAPPAERGLDWENVPGHSQHTWDQSARHEVPMYSAHSSLVPTPIQPLYSSVNVAAKRTSAGQDGPSPRNHARAPVPAAPVDDDGDLEDGDDDEDPLHMTSLDAPSKKSQGRKKIKIEYITENRPRQVSFLKRKNGLLKKAHNLSVLTGCNMAVIIFNRDNGKMYEYSNPSADETLTRYAGYRGPSERWSGTVRTLDGAKGNSDIPGEESGLVSAAEAAARMAATRHADTDTYIHPPAGRRRLHPNVTVPAVSVAIDVIHAPEAATAEDSQGPAEDGAPAASSGTAPQRTTGLAPTVVPALSTTESKCDPPLATEPALSPTTPGEQAANDEFAQDSSPRSGEKRVLGRPAVHSEAPDAKRRRDEISPAMRQEIAFRRSSSPSAPPQSSQTDPPTPAGSSVGLPSTSTPASFEMPSIPMSGSLAAVASTSEQTALISESVSIDFHLPATATGSSSIPIATTPVTPAERGEGAWETSPVRPVIFDTERFEAIPALPPLVPQLTYDAHGTHCPTSKSDGRRRSAFDALPSPHDVGLMPLGEPGEAGFEQTKATTD